jgi:hypothetical protein
MGDDSITCTLRSWANIIVSGPTVSFPASEDFMGRQQQITIAAARAAHEVRRIICAAVAGSCENTPAFDDLEDEHRRQVVEHTSHVLEGNLSADEGDMVARITADAIRARDEKAEEAATVEQIDTSVASVSEIKKALAAGPIKKIAAECATEDTKKNELLAAVDFADLRKDPIVKLMLGDKPPNETQKFTREDVKAAREALAEKEDPK